MAYLSGDICDLLTGDNLDSLNKANIWTINDLCSKDIMDIRRLTNMKYSTLKEIINVIKSRYTIKCHEASFLFDQKIQEYELCSTGLPELTQILDGGFQTQEIIELFGDSECGKTEMCYLICGEILSHYESFHISFISPNFDIDHEKIAHYTRFKAGNREYSDDEMFKCLSRVEVARPNKLADLVHLLNTLVHRRSLIKCIIIDSLSFIIQEDILEIKTSNLNDVEGLNKFSALKGKSSLIYQDANATDESKRKDFIDIYLHEVMRLLINIATTKNVIIIITNSDSQLTYSKSWTNAIDHRIQLSRMPEYSNYYLHNPRSTVLKATILKTIHNIGKLGHSIPFAINDEGLFAIRLTGV